MDSVIRFDIYQCLLTDASMPWLEENRNLLLFSQFTSKIDFSGCTTSLQFFTLLTAILQQTDCHLPSSFLMEAERLCTGPRQANDRFAKVFRALPVTDVRELFYNTLTGFCLDAYFHAAKTLFPGGQVHEVS